MRILVTGGAGYIGSHTLLELLDQGHEVFVLDNYDNSSSVVIDRVRTLSNGGTITAHEGDIRYSQTLDDVMRDFAPDAVIHFAGLKSVGDSKINPLSYYDVNVNGTLTLLHAMDKHKCRRIIFSSSATVYGEPVYLPYDEDHPLNPISVYGRTKMIAEHVITDWVRTHADASGVLLRYFNPVGAHPSARIGESPSDAPSNLMPFIAQVAVGKRTCLSIFGDDYDTPDGTGQRDYIHVVDLARAHVAALDYAVRVPGARAFNIGTGRAESVIDLVKAFEAVCGKPIAYKVTPRRDGDIATMQANATRANTELGWRATHNLKDMAASTWAWQSQNPNGY